ncbi:hypothetical protein HOA59_03165 [archaeon]|jgi:methionine-rich copper-binding protein CopC|nr:hypothetical protein [archaeon]
MKGYKIMTAMLLVLVILLGFAGTTIANSVENTDKSANYSIEEVSINGFDFDEEDFVFTLERGDTLELEVLLKADGEVEDVRIEATLEDSEYDLESKTSKFDVVENGYYVKTLTIELPEDLEVGNHSLDIEAYNYDSNNKREYTLFRATINVELSNTLEIYDLVFTPRDLNVEAGEIMFASVGVRNLGDLQDDVRVYMSIPELNLEDYTTLFDLYSEEDYNNDSDDDYKVHKDLAMLIPSGTQAGEYDVVIEVVYDDGDEVVTETETIVIGGAAATTDDAIVSIDVESQNIVRGSGAVYRLLFANLDSGAITYTVEVEDISAWGTARADPLTLTVSSDDSGEMFIYVYANEDASYESNEFTVKVLSGSSVVKEFSLTANVIESVNTSGLDDVRVGLEIGFAVLLVILVILGIVLMAKKLGKGNDGEEPLIEEGQSYY